MEKGSVAENSLKQLNKEISRLSQLNVLNDVFSIYFDEKTGTINQLKLGKKSLD